MKTFTSRLRQFVKSEDGISSVEYALLLSFVGAGVIAGALAVGNAVQGEMDQAATAIGGAVDPANLDQ